jgi:hypothetical protein
MHKQQLDARPACRWHITPYGWGGWWGGEGGLEGARVFASVLMVFGSKQAETRREEQLFGNCRGTLWKV